MAGGVLDTIAGMATKMGSKLAAPQSGESEAIKARKDNIDEYMKAVQRTPEAPTAPTPTSNADKINPKAKFGDRPGEMRPGAGGMPVYHDGVDSVPKTGPAMLEKGEAVISKEENPMNKDSFKMVPGVSGEKPAKEISHMVHRKDKKTKKHVVEHHHTSPAHPVEHHHLDSMDAVHDHMEEHMGEPNPGEAEADAGQHGIPEGTPGMPAAPAPMAGAGA